MTDGILLGSVLFPTKSLARDYLRDMLRRYAPGQPIGPDEAEILLSVIEMHPQQGQKVGPGIVGFYVGVAPQFPQQRCFHLMRVDGSTTDFSFYKALKHPTVEQVVRRACRNEIRGQIVAFRDADWPVSAVFPRKCPILSVEFYRENAHVDHQPPNTFAALVMQWLASKCLDPDDVAVSEPEDNATVLTLVDPIQRESWQQFHRARARLRLVSAAGNLSLSKTPNPN